MTAHNQFITTLQPYITDLKEQNKEFWRHQFAGMAMQGMIMGVRNSDEEVIARLSVRCADALIAELEKKP